MPTPSRVVVFEAVPPAMAFVFALILVTLLLFAWEPVPVDITAIGVMVALLLAAALSQTAADWGLLDAPVLILRDSADQSIAVAMERGLSGFANAATITVLAMFVLSEGVRRTGIIQRLGAWISGITGEDEGRQLGATIGLVGPISGFINNTAAVAILLPMVRDLAHRGRTSPSKLLMPLSFASMFGGMLTVIGTSTNILASQLSGRLLGRPINMFEFTHLGAILLILGSIYLLTVGRWLVPARIDPREDLTEEFGMQDYLTEVVVRADSPLIGQTVRQGIAESDFDVDVIQLIRDDEVFLEPLGRKQIAAGDTFALRTDRETLVDLLDVEGLDIVPDVAVTESELEAAEGGQNLVELVVAPGSDLVGNTLATANFRHRYDATVLAIRRGGELVHDRMDRVSLRVGDALLVQGSNQSIERLNANPDLIVAQTIERPDVRRSKVPIALGIVAAVVFAAGFTPVPIVAAALTGALAMVVTGCLDPPEVYDAVQWDIIFLLAGVIPLGIALERTGGADLIADGLVSVAPGLPPIMVLGLLYVVTALLTNVISNNASVVLMIPVAVQAATTLDANAFAFVLGVTFAASTAFMTPVGYQTNLFVYGPGGYRFTDYIRVGAPLQAMFAVVTTIGIALFWGL